VLIGSATSQMDLLEGCATAQDWLNALVALHAACSPGQLSSSRTAWPGTEESIVGSALLENGERSHVDLVRRADASCAASIEMT
jgi:hypothetical protein